MSSHTSQTCNTIEMSREQLDPRPKAIARAVALGHTSKAAYAEPPPPNNAPLPPGLTLWCSKPCCSYLHGEQAQHRPHPRFVGGYCAAKCSSIWHNLGRCGRQSSRVSRLYMKVRQKNLSTPKMVSIQIDEAADGGHTSRCGLLACTHRMFLALGHLDPRPGHPCKRKNEKEAQ